MFDRKTPEEIAATLDEIAVPMFCVERASGGAPWVLQCINSAHAEASGMSKAAVAGQKIRKLLPPTDAEWACARYDECAARGAPTRYLERLTIAGKRQAWDTNLQWARLSNRRERVIGTALVLPALPATDDHGAINEIRDWAVEADFHLTRVTAFLETVSENPRADLDPAVLGAMAGVCRSVACLVDDIRRHADACNRTRSAWAAQARPMAEWLSNLNFPRQPAQLRSIDLEFTSR